MCPFILPRRCRAAAWLLAAATLIIPLRARAEEPSVHEFCVKKKAERQRQAFAARRAVAELQLYRSQAAELLPIIEQAARMHTERYEQEAAMVPEKIDAFTAFTLQDQQNQGFTSEVERKTARVNRRAKNLRDETTTRLIQLEDKAAAVLSKRQRMLAGYDQPATRPRSATASKSDALAVARNELKQLHKQVHPRLGKLGQFLLHPSAGVAVAEIAAVPAPQTISHAVRTLEYGTSDYPIDALDIQLAEVKRLRVEINNWNLINGLHLDHEQIHQILQFYDSVAPTPVFASGPSINKGKKHMSRQHKVALERAIEDVLNLGQLQVLADYKACLIPPKNLRDPVRIGQVTNSSRQEKWLLKVRRAPARRAQTMVDELMQEEAEKYGALSHAEDTNRRSMLVQTARQVRRMSDVEFELSKAELAEQIAPMDRIKLLKQRITQLSRDRGLPSLVAQHMIKPSFMDQLRIRGYHLHERVEPHKFDLAKGPQAPNCEKGCALPKTKATIFKKN